MNKIDLRTCDWNDLPNGWTLDGGEIIRQNVDIIHQRIEEFIKNIPKGGSPETGKFLGKFYNPKKPTPQELLDQAMSLSNKIDSGIADLIKETSRLSDEEKSKISKEGGFKDLKESLSKLVDEFDRFDELMDKNKEDE